MYFLNLLKLKSKRKAADISLTSFSFRANFSYTPPPGFRNLLFTKIGLASKEGINSGGFTCSFSFPLGSLPSIQLTWTTNIKNKTLDFSKFYCCKKYYNRIIVTSSKRLVFPIGIFNKRERKKSAYNLTKFHQPVLCSN